MRRASDPYRGFRFPAEIIAHAVWLYHCFSLSLRGIEALGYDPGLLFVGPAPPPTNPGDDLHPAEAVGVRTIRTTMITHRSRARSNPLWPIILDVLSQPARCPADDAYDVPALGEEAALTSIADPVQLDGEPLEIGNLAFDGRQMLTGDLTDYATLTWRGRPGSGSSSAIVYNGARNSSLPCASR